MTSVGQTNKICSLLSRSSSSSSSKWQQRSLPAPRVMLSLHGFIQKRFSRGLQSIHSSATVIPGKLFGPVCPLLFHKKWEYSATLFLSLLTPCLVCICKIFGHTLTSKWEHDVIGASFIIYITVSIHRWIKQMGKNCENTVISIIASDHIRQSA